MAITGMYKSLVVLVLNTYSGTLTNTHTEVSGSGSVYRTVELCWFRCYCAAQTRIWTQKGDSGRKADKRKRVKLITLSWIRMTTMKPAVPATIIFVLLREIQSQFQYYFFWHWIERKDISRTHFLIIVLWIVCAFWPNRFEICEIKYKTN